MRNKLMLAGVAVALVAFAPHTPADDPAPASPTQPPAGDTAAHRVMEQAHRAMHEAMMEHATPPPFAGEMPAHAAEHAAAGLANAQMHRDAAEHVAQRHAAMQGEHHRDRNRVGGDPANRGAHDGMANGMGHDNAGAGTCDGAAESMRDVERHGPGGMMGDHGGTPPGGSGTGTDPHAGPGHMATR